MSLDTTDNAACAKAADAAERSSGRVDASALGTVCCLLSAVCYTGANICLRQLAALGADELWAICMKELVTVVTVGPWLVWRRAQGQRFAVPPATLWLLIGVALATELIGNVGVQWAFGVVGLSVTVPLIFGVMLTASGLLGWVWLGERVGARAAAAIVLITLAIVFLSRGAETVSQSVTHGSVRPLLVFLGVLAACVGGVVYAGLSTTIRSPAVSSLPAPLVVFVVTATGVVSLGSLSVLRLGPNALLHTPLEQLGWMLASGSFNVVGFLLITKGLQLTTVVRANLLNTTQVALAAVAGVLLFGETVSTWLLLGLGLTLVGIALISQAGSN